MIVVVVGEGGAGCSVIVLDVTDAKPAALNSMAYEPSGPLMARSSNLTWPSLPVSRVSVPERVPPAPGASAAVMPTPACPSLCPFASSSCSSGWSWKTVPLIAVLDGCLWIERLGEPTTWGVTPELGEKFSSPE